MGAGGPGEPSGSDTALQEGGCGGGGGGGSDRVRCLVRGLFFLADRTAITGTAYYRDGTVAASAVHRRPLLRTLIAKGGVMSHYHWGVTAFLNNRFLGRVTSRRSVAEKVDVNKGKK